MNETTELIMKQLNQKKTHAITHEVGGGDEIDATKLKNIGNYLETDGDFTGTWNGLPMTQVDIGLETAFNALKADVVQRGVTYNMFRSVSTDDGVMIKAAHDYANANNLPITNPSGEYWINSVRDIPVMTNTDLGRSIFHINDKYLNEPVFRIKTDQVTTTIADTGGLYTTILGYLKKCATPTISQLATYRNSMVEFIDSGHKVYARNGSTVTSGEDMTTLCYVNDYGKIEGEISFDFTGLTSVKVTPINQNYLDFKGGTFLMSGDSDSSIETLTDSYRESLIKCERSRTRILEQFIGFDAGKVDANVYDTNGLIRVEYCYDVEINTVRNQGMLGGGYGFGFYKVTKLSLQNIDANAAYATWGITGANWLKNVVVNNCKLSRFDTHVHCWNLSIKQCVIGTGGITLSGGGNLVIEDTTCEAQCFSQFRADFGASWDGDISVRRSKLKPTNEIDVDVFDSSSMKLLFFRVSDFDYKIPIVHGRNILVEDFMFDYSNLSSKPTFNEPSFFYSKLLGTTLIGSGNFYLPDSMVFRRVRKNRADTTDPSTKVHIENLSFGKVTKAKGTYGTGIGGDGYRCNSTIVIDNCDVDNYQRLQQNSTRAVVYFKGDPAFVVGAYTPIYSIAINQCLEVKIKIEGLPAYIRIMNSDVCAVDLSSDGVTTNTNILAYAVFENCNIRIDGTSTVYGTDSRTAFYLRQGTNGKFINCHLGMPLINSVNASTAQIRRVYKNSIIDLEGKLMMTNLSGITMDESLVTAVGVLAAERQKIFQGCAYVSGGVSYVSYLTSISATPAYVGQEALVSGIWYRAIGTTSTADWKALN